MATTNNGITNGADSDAPRVAPPENRLWAIVEAHPFLRRVLPWAGRALLTMVALGVLGVCLKFALLAQSFLASSRSQGPPPIYLSSAPHSSGDTSIITPWPEFPHSGPRHARTSVINGVRTLSEGWTTSAAVADVLAYYREQMISRGWRDVTEETYSLQPEAHLNLKSSDAESYTDNYRKIMNSTVVLTSGQWTMHIVAAASQSLPENRIAIYAVEASSLKDFSESLQATLLPNAQRPLEALQRSGGQLYRTTMSTKDEPMAEAFQREIGALAAEGWRSLVLLPSQQGRPSQFAWLAKGETYMAVSASPLAQGRCSITRTQVTPDSAKGGH